MLFHLRGVRLPHRKQTVNREAVRMDPPTSVTIPMSMHIGAPAQPVVGVGDEVKVGTLIARQVGFISSPVYASVSGKVKAITELVKSDGTKGQAVVIESDGLMEPDPSLVPPTVTTREEFVEAVRASGTVGLGGAGFPTYVKFSVEPSRIEYLLVNAAECEPYITSDTYTLLERGADMLYVIRQIKEFYGVEKVIIGLESGNAHAIEAANALVKDDPYISVAVLPRLYPQGGEKVLIYHTTGRQVPTGKLPIDVGCLVVNCTTLAQLGCYMLTGMPLCKKWVTVDGGAVKRPQNVIVPIGTSVRELLDFCGGLTEPPAEVLYGGPMMGIGLPNMDAPILKNTNAILALTEAEAALPKTTACIRCGRCANICPFGINPAAIARAYGKGDLEALPRLGTELCMECGCCSFVCPANRPLVQTNKLAKAALRERRQREAQK